MLTKPLEQMEEPDWIHYWVSLVGDSVPVPIIMHPDYYGRIRHAFRKGQHYRPRLRPSIEGNRRVRRWRASFRSYRRVYDNRPHPHWDPRARGDIAWSWKKRVDIT